MIIMSSKCPFHAAVDCLSVLSWEPVPMGSGLFLNLSMELWCCFFSLNVFKIQRLPV